MFSHGGTTTTTTDNYNTAAQPTRRHAMAAHHTRVWPTALLALGTWAVSLAALASLQSDACNDATITQTPALGGTFNGLHDTCKSVFRFNWFIVSFEFVLLVLVFMGLIMRRAYHMRVALVALLSIATVLYIYWTDQYLTAINNLPMYSDGQPKHRARTMLAGALMTAAANMFLILALGHSDHNAYELHTTHTHTHVKNHGHNNDVMIPVNNANMVPVNVQHV